MQFPRNLNTRSSELVSHLNLTGSLKSQVFSAFSPSSKMENCVHPPKLGLNQGFVRSKFFLRKGVSLTLALFPLFVAFMLKGGELKFSIWQNVISLPPRKLVDPRSRFFNTNAAQGKGSWWSFDYNLLVGVPRLRNLLKTPWQLVNIYIEIGIYINTY